MTLEYPNKQSKENIIKASKMFKPIEYDNKHSYLYFGDNFSVLSSLLNYNSNTIDLIYIDPPFFTNNDFYISKDRANTISSSKLDREKAYSDKFKRNDYFNFLRKRLIILRELLSERGSLYIHIDYKIGHYIKILLDEIFGIDCFKNDITRIKSNPKNFARKAYGNIKDMILFYVKNNNNYIWNEIKQYTLDNIDKKFPKVDSEGRRYTTVPCHAPGETVAGKTNSLWQGLYPPKGRHWRMDILELEKLNNNGLVEWSKTGNPRIIKYADEYKGAKMQDVWLDYKDPQYPLYPTHKNEDMLDMIIKQSSNKDSLLLDCFAGSGSFLNAAYKNERYFIGIDNSDISIKTIKSRDIGNYCFIDYNSINNNENIKVNNG